MTYKGYAVCGIVEINEKVLFVRHTYGRAKNRILIPGGYVKEGELPARAMERELLEETGVTARSSRLMGMQFKPDEWCVIFIMEYLSGKPHSDGYENSEVLLLSPEEAVKREDITNLSREIMTAYMNSDFSLLKKREYIPQNSDPALYSLYL